MIKKENTIRRYGMEHGTEDKYADAYEVFADLRNWDIIESKIEWAGNYERFVYIFPTED